MFVIMNTIVLLDLSDRLNKALKIHRESFAMNMAVHNEQLIGSIFREFPNALIIGSAIIGALVTLAVWHILSEGHSKQPFGTLTNDAPATTVGAHAARPRTIARRSDR